MRHSKSIPFESASRNYNVLCGFTLADMPPVPNGYVVGRREFQNQLNSLWISNHLGTLYFSTRDLK